jgi:hypothetical protein
MWVKLSSNFHGNQSSTNKVVHFWVKGMGSGGGNRIFLSAEGAGNGRLQPQLRLQGVPDARARITPNVAPGAVVTRGQWQHWEVLLTMNTPGQPNGQAQWWIDGQLVTDVRDLTIAAAGEPGTLFQLQWSPTYGGGGAPVPYDMYLWFDHAYVSVK